MAAVSVKRSFGLPVRHTVITWLIVMTDCVGVFEAKFTLQLIAPYSIVRTALARGSTSRSHTSNMVLAQLAERVWWTKFQSSLLNIYFRLSEFQAPSPTYLLPQRKKNYPICDTPLRDRRGAPSLHHRNRGPTIVLVCKQKLYPVWF